MRILVVSDTHGNVMALERAIYMQPESQLVIHLGDGASDAQRLAHLHKDKLFLCVNGNCDLSGGFPELVEYTVRKKNILMTHGHIFGVKRDLSGLVARARESGTDILLFGHTHRAFTHYQKGLYVMNPGSLNGAGGTYGFIDIVNGSVVMNIVEM